MQILLYVAALACCVCAGLAVVFRAGRQRLRALVSSNVIELFSDNPVSVGPGQLSAVRDSLPDPVQRYLRYAIPEGTPGVATVHLEHDGAFRPKPGQRWFPIEGDQHFTVAKPGFVWNGCIRAAPVIWIEACDSLLSGRGNMLVKFNSSFTLAEARGRETDQSASTRWLMEAVWFPYAFAGELMQWDPIDDRTARVTLLHSGLPVSAVVEIDEQGRMVSLTGDRYYDDGSGKPVLTRFTGVCKEYREFSGFRIPSLIEASWMLPQGEFSFVRFRVRSVEYSAG